MVYENLGPTDLTGVLLSDTYGFSQTGSTAIATVSCEPSSTIPCPSWIPQGTVTYPSGAGSTFYSQPTDFPAGSRLELKIRVTHNVPCAGGGLIAKSAWAVMSAANVVGVAVIPPTARADVSGRVFSNDVTTVTAVSDSQPQPYEPLTVTSTITNACGAISHVPIEVMLPEDGIIVGGDVLPQCQATGTAQCPADLAYDPIRRVITGTLTALPANTQVRLSLAARAGVVPSPTYSYAVTTNAISPGDTNTNSNLSDATFGFTNTQTTVRLNHEVRALPPGGVPAEMTFTGTLVCAESGTFPATFTVPQGGTTAGAIVTTEVWRSDTCTLTTERPSPPEGFVWTDSTPGSTTATDEVIVSPVSHSYVWMLTKPAVNVTAPALPLTGGLGADWIYLLGTAVVALGGLLTLALLAVRRIAH
ncbi:hypothetical protein [Schaalia suimastitidis]|uniref:hypothetical protein n=1 Tax=Schaalia suimastitidis TaxID=121163 RepID=UPI0004185BAC|nr:hypothetical protein [Schaalia suimastitidis]